MFKNYLKIAFRNLRKQKYYSLINILRLSIGIAFCLNFAYRINIQIWVFIFAGILTLLVALITIGYQSIRAALANPIESLKYE